MFKHETYGPAADKSTTQVHNDRTKHELADQAFCNAASIILTDIIVHVLKCTAKIMSVVSTLTA